MSGSGVLPEIISLFRCCIQDSETEPIQEDGVYSVTPEGALIISSVQSEHQGAYTCRAQNDVGSVQAAALVRLVGKRRSGSVQAHCIRVPDEWRQQARSSFRKWRRFSRNPW